MVDLFRSKLAAAATVVVFTAAACCSPSQQADTCKDSSAADAEMGQGNDAMAMETDPCPLVKLTKNDPDPPLYPDIGSAHWHVPWGQEYFDQGLRFYFGFNNRESYRAFKKAAQQAEENRIPCSACYWAQALVLGVDLNLGKQLEPDRDAANDALRRAVREEPNAEDWEIIQALLKRYQDCKNSESPRECQTNRNLAYYDGMRGVLNRFGKDDPNAITLVADAAMNITAWAYWKDGVSVDDRVNDVRKDLERALDFVQYPPNEGPIHWYIHLMEQSPTPGAATRAADWLASLAPNSGHLVHMPSHIYFRTGDMQNAIRANKEAVDADDRYFATEPDLYRPDGDRYRFGYYLHNINFVLGAAALSGNKDDDINLYADKLLQSAPDKANGFRADMYRTAYYLAKMNFSSAADIRNFAAPDVMTKQPLANVAYDFTRLMADIWDNHPNASVDKVDADAATYRKYLSNKGTANADCAIGRGLKPEMCLPAILSALAHARVKALKRDWDAALTFAQSAARIQDRLQYDEPPLWPYPARQTWASILIRKAEDQGRTAPSYTNDLAEAKGLLSESLHKSKNPNEMPTGSYPGNGWAYYGLLEVALADGSAEKVINDARAELAKYWFGGCEFRKLERM